MFDATRRRLKSRAPQHKKKGDPPREKRDAEAEAVHEVHLQMMGKRQIEGALEVTPLLNRPRGPKEDAAILIPSDEVEGDAKLVNMALPRKVVTFMNCIIDGAQMELYELEQLPVKTMRVQAGQAFRLHAERALNVAERFQKRFEDS
ncbi:unnamed protein product [Prunus armeniaca]